MGRGPGRRSSEADAAIRRRLAYEKSCMGWPQPRIAEHLGVSQQQVSYDLKAYRKSLTPLDREEMRREHHERAQMMRIKLEELITLAGAPVTAGKDGTVVYDPESGEVVRDYAGQVAAIRELRAWDERTAKLADLDEKINRTESAVDVTVHGSVDDELNALAAELRLNDAGPSTKAYPDGDHEESTVDQEA